MEDIKTEASLRRGNRSDPERDKVIIKKQLRDN